MPSQTTMDAFHIAKLYLKEIARLHGVMKSITSNWHIKFISHFWRTLWKLLGSELTFSTAYHSQSYGQTEVTYRNLGNLIWSSVGSNDKQWDQVLSHAKFSYNRSRNGSMKMSPFEIVNGQNPNSILDLVPLPLKDRVNYKAEEMVEHIKHIHETVRKHIEDNNWKYKERVDKGRRRVVFEASDYVWAVLTWDRYTTGEYN